MFKQKSARIKKRTFVVLAFCLLALILPVIFLFHFSKKEIESSNMAVFSLEESASRHLVQGTGLNISSPDNGNFLDNNSFEPLVYRQNLTIDSAEKDKIKVAMPNDPRTGVYPDDFFLNAKTNVITVDADGNRFLKKTGQIKQYVSDQIDDFRPVSLPVDLPSDISWSSFAEQDMRIVLGDNRGYLLSIDSFSENNLLRLPNHKGISGITSIENQFLILDKEGYFYRLDKQGDLKFLFKAEDLLLNFNFISDKFEWFDLASRKDANGNWQFMAVGQDGFYIYGDIDNYQLGQLDVFKDIRSITSNEDGFYLVGDDSLALYTRNCENFRYLDISVMADWSTVSSRGKQVMIAGEQGQVVYSQDGLSYKDLSDESIREISQQFTKNQTETDQEIIVFNPNFVSSSILSNKQLVIIDSRGLIYYSDNLGETWKSVLDSDFDMNLDYQLEDATFNMVQRTSSGQLIVTTQDGLIFYAMMGLRLELDTSLEQGSYENGDILEIEQLSAYPIFKPQLKDNESLIGEWYVSDSEAAEIQFSESSPRGGQTALAIDLSAAKLNGDYLTGIYSQEKIEKNMQTNSFVLQQKITNDVKEIIKNNTLFSYEFWAKTTSENPVSFTLSITSLDVQHEQVDREIKGDWQKYQGVFLLPRHAVREDKDHCISLSFSGSDQIYIDSIWIGLSENITQEFTSNYKVELPQTAIMRLDFIPIGKSEYPKESWLTTDKSYNFFHQNNSQLELIDQTNLVRSLELCNKNRSNPWLIIDSQATDSEIKHLIQYLFGQQNTNYGELRMQHGAMGRYSDIFEQVYFEITDQNNVFENDWQKHSYVNWVIKVITETPEYLQIKNRIIFVDGMSYKDNIAMSDADYHASDVLLDSQILNKEDLLLFDAEFNELIPRDPGRAMFARSELVRSTSLLSEDLRLADVLVSGLSMLGDKKSASLLDFDLSTDLKSNNLAYNYGQIGSYVSGMNPYVLSSRNQQDKVIGFAFGRDNIRTIVLINLSDEATSSQLTNVNLKNFEQTIYDGEGVLLEQKLVKREKTVFSLLPGGVVVLHGELNGK